VNVLVVEDVPDVALTFAGLIRAYGHRAHVAYDGETALRVAREFKPHTVFIDIGLPGMDGYQLAERLREMEGLDRAYLVSVSGQECDAERFQQAGLNLHLKKPVMMASLIGLLSGDAVDAAR